MLGFYDKISEIKEAYLNKVTEEAGKYDNIVIYGAGRVAKPIAHKFEEERVKVNFFAVTDKNINEDCFLGVPVVQIDEMHLDAEKTLIIIAVKYVWAKDVLESIQRHGYKNYIFPPKEIDYFAREDSDKVHRPVMEISLKAGCSVNCKYCPQELFLKTYFAEKGRCGELSFENFKTCLQKLPKDTIVSFCGFVEPFLNPEAIEMIEYTHKAGYEMKLFTTLVGLTVEGFERIKNIPFTYVVLHTPDDKEYANIPMTEEYFKLLNLVIGHKKQNGQNFVDTANCQGIPHPKVVEVTKGKLRIMSELYDRAGNIKDEELFAKKEKKQGKLYCCRVNRKLDYNVMLPDGTVVLCDFDFGMKHVLGNLLYDSYDEIMNGERMQAVVKALDDEKCELLCRNCNYAVEVLE